MAMKTLTYDQFKKKYGFDDEALNFVLAFEHGLRDSAELLIKDRDLYLATDVDPKNGYATVNAFFSRDQFRPVKLTVPLNDIRVRYYPPPFDRYVRKRDAQIQKAELKRRKKAAKAAAKRPPAPQKRRSARPSNPRPTSAKNPGNPHPRNNPGHAASNQRWEPGELLTNRPRLVDMRPGFFVPRDE